MLRIFLLCLSALLAGTAGLAAEPNGDAVPVTKRVKMTVLVIPVRDEIGSPVLYLLRRGLKEAEREKADLVVLDMKTPGGALDTTFDIMEALAKFSGRTITYVDSEAMSAGAFIAASTDEIWFSPNGVIGASDDGRHRWAGAYVKLTAHPGNPAEPVDTPHIAYTDTTTIPYDVMVTGAVSLLRDDFVQPSGGIEMNYSWLSGYNIALRAGARRSAVGEDPFTGGAGFTMDRLSIDYGFEMLSDKRLGHRIGLRVR